jgi:superfamily II DNA/RNA helicase
METKFVSHSRRIVFCKFCLTSLLQTSFQEHILLFLFQDVAGRGVDFPEIDMIVQYTPPQKLFDYVHRVGRTGMLLRTIYKILMLTFRFFNFSTGRAGRKGTAVTFLTPYEQEYVNLLETNRIQ